MSFGTGPGPVGPGGMLGGMLGGLFGGGGGGGGYGPGGYGPRGPYGAYPGCGCSSFFIVAAGILLVFGGMMRGCGM